jgi:hypothetical protein
MVQTGYARAVAIEAPVRDPRAERFLRYAALAFLAGFVFHNLDHLRRGFGALTPQVLWAGTALGVISITAIAFALIGHRLAPLVAVVVAFPAAIGVAASHLLPHWSSLSDAFPGSGVDAISWAAVLSEIAGALALGLAGAYALRRGRMLRPAPAEA